MPEKGWYSLTIRKETALKVRELAKNKDLYRLEALLEKEAKLPVEVVEL